uniref:Puroindoline-like protein n=1 Tax=Brachypodium sylvaticum TaxID=29664 RepID=C3TX90_BRASY|nr:puroindoline-like protein [Brachypodium sylvaticum]
MKTFFLLALLSLAASTAFAQDVQGRDPYYEQCPMRKLDVCQDYIAQRCNPGKTAYRWYKSCQEVQGLCCQQLEETSQQCLCKTICKGVQSELSAILTKSDLYGPNLQGEVTMLMERAKNLPYTCSIPAVTYCNIPITTSGGCNIP